MSLIYNLILIVAGCWAVMFCTVFFFIVLAAFLESAAKLMARQPTGAASCAPPRSRLLGRQ